MSGDDECPICNAIGCESAVCRDEIAAFVERYTADLIAVFDDQGKFREIRRRSYVG